MSSPCRNRFFFLSVSSTFDGDDFHFFQVHEFLPHSAKRYLRFPVWEECHLLWQWAGTASSSCSPAQGKTHLYTRSSGQKSIFLVSGTLNKYYIDVHGEFFLHKYCVWLYFAVYLYINHTLAEGLFSDYYYSNSTITYWSVGKWGWGVKFTYIYQRKMYIFLSTQVFREYLICTRNKMRV